MREGLGLAMISACALLLMAGCDSLPAGPTRDNTHDPGSPNWSTQRPFIYSVAFTPDSNVVVKWVSNTDFGVEFTIERRIANTGTYSLIGSLPGPVATGAFIDATKPPKGHTYAYRVGTVGSGGGTTYSYDFPIDIF